VVDLARRASQRRQLVQGTPVVTVCGLSPGDLNRLRVNPGVGRGHGRIGLGSGGSALRDDRLVFGQRLVMTFRSPVQCLGRFVELGVGIAGECLGLFVLHPASSGRDLSSSGAILASRVPQPLVPWGHRGVVGRTLRGCRVPGGSGEGLGFRGATVDLLEFLTLLLLQFLLSFVEQLF
jgi:hypothetical protein